MIIVAAHGASLPLFLFLGFVACWLVGVTAFVKAYSNLQPGIRWWRAPMCSTRDDFQRTFTPKGIFWVKVSVCAWIAAFVICVIVVSRAG
jgi:hypothetical protein